jgi:hypothetical protein
VFLPTQLGTHDWNCQVDRTRRRSQPRPGLRHRTSTGPNRPLRHPHRTGSGESRCGKQKGCEQKDSRSTGRASTSPRTPASRQRSSRCRSITASWTFSSTTPGSCPRPPTPATTSSPTRRRSGIPSAPIFSGPAKKLAGTDIKVTAVCPGFVQTDLTPTNRDQAPCTAEQAAHGVVAAATLPADAASGTFIDVNGTVAW